MYFEFSKSYSVILSSNDVSAIKVEEEEEEGAAGKKLEGAWLDFVEVHPKVPVFSPCSFLS